jgi:hypothetical protein
MIDGGIAVPTDVIQGCFPNGIPRVAQNAQTAQPFAGHATPSWVQAAIGQHNAPQPVQRFAAPAARTAQTFPNATQLPAHLTPRAASPGQPLPPQVRQRMEAAFQTSFSDVRIHINPQAQALGATSFTQGSNIHFAPGHYDPHTPHGQQLLGRELAHVVQQRSGRVRNPFGNGVAVVHDRALEAEAERMAHTAATHLRNEATVQPKMANAPAVQLARSAKHGQIPGRLSRLSPGPAKDKASELLHHWKQSRGMKGASVTSRDESAELEFAMIVGLVKRYGSELYNEAHITKEELAAARFALLSREEQEWFNLPQAEPSPPPPPKVRPPLPARELIPGLVRDGHGAGKSIRELARTYGVTRREVRGYLNG